MVIEFETQRASRYVLNGLLSFIGDPPDTEFQTGYLAALLDIYKEGLNQGDSDDRIEYLASFIRGETESELTDDYVELADGISSGYGDFPVNAYYNPGDND